MYNIWPTDKDLVCQDTVPVEPELKKVREDRYEKGASVAFQLVSILYPIKVFNSRCLGLYISYDMLLSIPEAKIGISCVGLFRDSSDLYVFSINGFYIGVEEGLKSGIEAFFPGVSALGNLVDLF